MLALLTFFVCKDKVVVRSAFDSVLTVHDNITGAQLFEGCRFPHDLHKDATGAASAGGTKRWSEEWLRKWIRNSAKMISEDDPIAVSLYDQWHKVAMMNFPLSETEMDKLIVFLKTLE